MFQNVIDETRFYIFYGLFSPSTQSKSATEHFDVSIFNNALRNLFLVPVQVETIITRYQPLINRPGKTSFCCGPSHAISIKSGRYCWKKEFLNIVLMLFIEENCLTSSSGYTEDQGRNTIIKLPKTAFISFNKVWIQLI